MTRFLSQFVISFFSAFVFYLSAKHFIRINSDPAYSEFFDFSDFTDLNQFKLVHTLIPPLLTVMVCGILGLPIRLNRRLNIWWKEHYYISIAMVILGIFVSILSTCPSGLSTFK